MFSYCVVLDPRYKMDIIEYYNDKLYGKDLPNSVYKKYEQLLFNLYIDHGGRVISSKIIIGDSE